MKNNQKTNSLIIPIIIGIIFGILIGGFLPNIAKSIQFIGTLFINSLSMLIIPLVMTSMIVAVTSMGDIRQLKRIGSKTIIYYLITTGISVLIGLIIVSIIQPGIVDNQDSRVLIRGGQVLDEVVYNIDENNIYIEKEQFRNKFDPGYKVILLDQNNIQGIIETPKASSQYSLNTLTVKEWTNEKGEVATPKNQGRGLQIDLGIAQTVKGKEKRSITDVLEEMFVGLLPPNVFQAMAENKVLPLIVFSLFFAGVLSTLGEVSEPVISLINGLNEAFMKMIHVVLLAAPVGVGTLIAGRLGEAGGFSGFAAEFVSLGKYAIAVILGLAIHGLIILPLILKFMGRRKPVVYIKNMLPALTTAFSTSSSSATLPLSMECAIFNNRISPRIVNFVLPLGATVNMDGTALYEAVAAVFIAQIYGVNLSIPELIIVFLTATLAAIGAAGIPQAGLVTLVIVLKAVNLPVEGISLILVIDWFLDRCRTTVNVWGDAVGAAVIESSEDKR
ncbi:MAG: dicarboxylate/amino acid:cation symporter [Cyanobacteria bacterium P01_A01_bin.84]